MPKLSTCTAGRRPKAAGGGTRGEQGTTGNWRNAMRILTRRWGRERVNARPEAYVGLRNDALQWPLRHKGGDFAAVSGLAGGWIGPVGMLRGERRRGRAESGGGDSGQSVLKCLRSCS
jgi:hypothetical protein